MRHVHYPTQFFHINKIRNVYSYFGMILLLIKNISSVIINLVTSIKEEFGMKLVNKNIDMISWTSKDGSVTPVRFRLEESGKTIIIKVDHVIQTEKSKLGGSPTLSFLCSSIISNIEQVYELTCNCDSQKWLLRKK